MGAEEKKKKPSWFTAKKNKHVQSLKIWKTNTVLPAMFQNKAGPSTSTSASSSSGKTCADLPYGVAPNTCVICNNNYYIFLIFINYQGLKVMKILTNFAIKWQFFFSGRCPQTPAGDAAPRPPGYFQYFFERLTYIPANEVIQLLHKLTHVNFVGIYSVSLN